MMHAGSFEAFLSGVGDQFEVMESLIFTAPFPMWAKDYRNSEYGVMRIMSHAYSRIWPATPESYLGKSDYDAWSQFLPDEQARAIADAFRANDMAVMESGGPIDKLEDTPGATLPEYLRCRVIKWEQVPGSRVVMGVALPIPPECGNCDIFSVGAG